MEPIDWVRNPSLAPNGYRDSLVFVSVVTEIFEQARSHDQETDKLRDLLKYLLLRRHPVTDAVLPFDHNPSHSSETEHTTYLKSAAHRDITRYFNNELSHPYAILQLILESTRDRHARWRTHEEVTLWILALWLMSQRLDLRDKLVCHACFRLYYDSKSLARSNAEGEFNSDRLLMAVRITREAKRLCDRSYSVEEMTSALAYFGAFASLIRACRMVENGHPLNTLLREEITWLQGIDRRE